jgi:hypothetical protein
VDNNRERVIGHMVDISPAGLLIDTKALIATDQTFRLRLDFMEDINSRASLEITAICRWCQPDSKEPSVYNAGCEILDLSPVDYEIITNLVRKYGAE